MIFCDYKGNTVLWKRKKNIKKYTDKYGNTSNCTRDVATLEVCCFDLPSGKNCSWLAPSQWEHMVRVIAAQDRTLLMDSLCSRAPCWVGRGQKAHKGITFHVPWEGLGTCCSARPSGMCGERESSMPTLLSLFFFIILKVCFYWI